MLLRALPLVKVIATTGGIENVQFLETAKKLGATRIFQKPFKLEALLEAVRQELQRKPKRGVEDKSFVG